MLNRNMFISKISLCSLVMAKTQQKKNNSEILCNKYPTIEKSMRNKSHKKKIEIRKNNTRQTRTLSKKKQEKTAPAEAPAKRSKWRFIKLNDGIIDRL